VHLWQTADLLGPEAFVNAVPIASACALPFATAVATEKTMKCGESPPSVPPEITITTRLAISATV